MHPDRKIGIAMGILLVGVVAALFFRNEPLPVDDSLSVRRERELNDRLRERDVSVYLTDDDDPDADAEPQFDLPELMDRMRSRESVAPQPIGLTSSEPAVAGTSAVKHGTTDRMRFAPHEVATRKDTADDDGASASGTASPTMADILGAGAPGKTHTTASSPRFFEYTVQVGDTLSEISEKFLGSQSRYREVYEANKDRMASPDHLRVGKAIRIPRVIR
ncbi:MAG: LysM peptidoglycan-binding domain-containing protein [Fuerstiella sp.]|nr:LysM peptidoglycan-binding domain-containing protein [Fuerstiella sp.]